MPDSQQETARVRWHDGDVPVSERFGDAYFSAEGGLRETRHVYLDGNDLGARFRDGFSVAELGFGTGLNLLATWQAWQQSGACGVLYFTSFEAYPMAPADMTRALAPFTEIAPLAAALLDPLRQGKTRFSLGGVRVEILVGDAAARLPRWQGKADAWFLDGFAPARNPGLWTPELLAEVAAHTAPGGTVATYSAAGHIRRSLSDVGFSTDRRAGFGRKRHMTTGRLETQI